MEPKQKTDATVTALVWGGVALAGIGVILMMNPINEVGYSANEVAARFTNPDAVSTMNTLHSISSLAPFAVILGVAMVVVAAIRGFRMQAAGLLEVDRPCPFCAEPIKPEAIKCKHCGSVVAPSASDRRA